MLIFAETQKNTARVVQWMVARIPHMAGGDFGPCVAGGVVRDGAVVAAVAFHDWQGGYGTLQCSMAADTPRWATRGVLTALFHYAFVTAGANKLFTTTPHTNERALRFNAGIGMRREAVLRHQFGPKQHAVISSMMKSEWQRSRWMQE